MDRNLMNDANSTEGIVDAPMNEIEELETQVQRLEEVVETLKDEITELKSI